METSPTILIIDDEAPIRSMYAQAFINEGATVLEAATGRDGVATALSQHPDAILIDIEIPDMTGHEVVNAIRADAWGESATIIYLTNNDSPESVIYAVGRGSSKYIVKANTTPSEVVKGVFQVLEKQSSGHNTPTVA